MILVDTSVLVDFLRGTKSEASQKLKLVLQQAIPFGITSLIYQELLQGARSEKENRLLRRWNPQLGDADALVPSLPRLPGVSYVVLVPNAKGLDRLVDALRRSGEGAPDVAAAVFLSASESHNRRNLNRTVEESLRELEGVVPAARGHGLRVRGYVSTVFGCPYEGAVDPERAAAVAERLVALGCDQVSLGDTIGVATPALTRRVVGRLLRTLPAEKLALHMHDTRGTALANVLAGLDLGITTFDSSLGGLGGCPYAPGASGNLATEDLVYIAAGPDPLAVGFCSEIITLSPGFQPLPVTATGVPGLPDTGATVIDGVGAEAGRAGRLRSATLAGS